MSIITRFVPTIKELDSEQWQSLLSDDNPFLQYKFLELLETSEVIGMGTGWQPHYLVQIEGNELLGAMPLYKKYDSYGEYIFDWSWADAYHRYGLPYYPKLVSAIPFTPVNGARLLYKGQIDSKLIQSVVTAIKNEIETNGFSSIHVLYPDLALSKEFEQFGWSQRKNVQFHWNNRNYRDFEEFLASFTSRKRKNVKKERNKLTERGVSIKRYSRDELTEKHMRFFFMCYQQTYLKRSGHGGYLNLDFFLGLQQCMANQLMLVVAEKNDEPVASALYFHSSDTLFGRYWGMIEEVDGLHFECCYYQGIEFCIEQQLTRFNPGTQGEHKILRGFEPTYCYSNHWLKIQEFNEAVKRFMGQESEQLKSYKAQAEALLPFKVDA